MPGAIVLAGGEEFRAGCEVMDSAMLESTGASPPRVLILPTAAVTGPHKAASDGVTHFSRLGAAAAELMVFGPEEAEDEGLVGSVEGASVVFGRCFGT